MSKFFHFNQNNSGGGFDFDAEAGITRHVIIEAKDANHACEIAERIGLYFDGCDEGRDCPCCGDRWSRPWGDDGDDEPKLYGEPVAEHQHYVRWMRENPEVFVHYLDGRIVGDPQP